MRATAELARARAPAPAPTRAPPPPHARPRPRPHTRAPARAADSVDAHTHTHSLTHTLTHTRTRAGLDCASLLSGRIPPVPASLSAAAGARSSRCADRRDPCTHDTRARNCASARTARRKGGHGQPTSFETHSNIHIHTPAERSPEANFKLMPAVTHQRRQNTQGHRSEGSAYHTPRLRTRAPRDEYH